MNSATVRLSQMLLCKSLPKQRRKQFVDLRFMPRPRMVRNRDHEILYLFVNFVSVSQSATSDDIIYDQPELPPFARSRIDCFFRLFLPLACH